MTAKLLIFHHDARERVRRLGAAQASASASSAGAMPASMLGAGAEETP